MTAALVTASALLGMQLSAFGRQLFGIAITAAIMTPMLVTCEWTMCGSHTSSCATSSGETNRQPTVVSNKHYAVLPDDECSDNERSANREELGVQQESVYAQHLHPLRGTECNHDETVRIVDGGESETVELPELSTTKVVQTPECWLLGLGAVCLWGGGQMVSVNVNQMCESFGYGQPVRFSIPCCQLVQRHGSYMSTCRLRLYLYLL